MRALLCPASLKGVLAAPVLLPQRWQGGFAAPEPRPKSFRLRMAEKERLTSCTALSAVSGATPSSRIRSDGRSAPAGCSSVTDGR